MTKNRTPTPVYLDPGMHSGLEVKGLIGSFHEGLHVQFWTLGPTMALIGSFHEGLHVQFWTLGPTMALTFSLPYMTEISVVIRQ